VALDECRYDTKTSQPAEGSVVDSDEDLVTLCNRIQESDNRYCAIVYCDDAETAPPPTVRRTAPTHPAHFTPAPGRSYTH